MPLDEKILGFSNSWYAPAMAAAQERELEPGLKVRMVSPVDFLRNETGRPLPDGAKVIFRVAAISRISSQLLTVESN